MVAILAMAILKTESLSKSFGALAAVKDVSLAIEAGSLHSIIGPNGAGKTTLFNLLTGISQFQGMRRFVVAPFDLHRRMLELIDREARHAGKGLPARIIARMNSLVDDDIIRALYRASQAGVPVDIWVRGICAVRPGVPGLSENVRVRSVLGPFLEHSRIFAFGNGGEPEVWIGSADMMHRNLDRRVEALLRITDPRHLEELCSLVTRGMSGDYTHWKLAGDGRWTRHTTDADGAPLPDLQSALIEMHSKRRRKARRR